MTLSTKTRLGAATILGLLFSLMDIGYHRHWHTRGKQAYLDWESRWFDRASGTLHPGRSVVYGLVMVAIVIGVYELVNRILMAIMRRSATHVAGA
jgi:hypothetical protein